MTEAGAAEWSVYLLRAGDGSLYTGIATDVARRISEHERSGRGARYLRGRGPLTLICERRIGDRSLASRVEHRIKGLPKADKEAIARSPELLEDLLEALLEELGVRVSTTPPADPLATARR